MTSILESSSSNEWYTPAHYVEAAKLLMCGIDLDPASCDVANQTVRAGHYYTQEDDGLGKRWFGRVWCNPPYGTQAGVSNQATWSQYLIQQFEVGNVTEAVLLVNAVPGNRWFGRLWDYTICFASRRIVFTGQDGRSSQPTHSNALVYLGSNPLAFAGIFRQFGNVVGDSVGLVRATNQRQATQFRLEEGG